MGGLLEKCRQILSSPSSSTTATAITTSTSAIIHHAGTSSNSPLAFTTQEKQELQRRKALLLLYFFRSPLYELSLKQLAFACQGLGGNIPIVGGMVNYIVRALTYIQKHHHYTLGS